MKTPNPFLIAEREAAEAEIELARMMRAAGQLPERQATPDEAILSHALREWRVCRRLGTSDHNARVVAVCATARALGLARSTVRALLDAALASRADVDSQL